MLGRLAKWMRLVGLDTLYYNNPGDPSILHKALEEGRTILTRSSKHANYKNSILVESEILDEQLDQVKEIIEITSPLSRCPLCNTQLTGVNKEEIKKDVPEYIYKVHNDFKRCAYCGRIYWKGTHYKEIMRKINEILK